MTFLTLNKATYEIEYDNKQYTISPLSFREFAKYILWYKYKEVEEVKEATIDYPKELRNKLIEEAHNRCITKGWRFLDETTGEVAITDYSWECPEIQDSLSTAWGIEKQLLLAIQIVHPEVTRDLLAKIMPVCKYADFQIKWLEINGLLKTVDAEEEGTDKDPFSEEIKNQSSP